MGSQIHHVDVKMTFLNALIKEEVYIEQPEGFETHERRTHVCRLKKALNELKQAPKARYFQHMGFVKSDTDPNLYYLMVEDEPLFLVLYVDDLFLTGSLRLIKDCKRNPAAKFDMKDLGLMHCFLGLEVWQKEGEIFLGQGRYATDILKRSRMQDCIPMSTPMITNWKKIDALDDKDVDPTLYRQLIDYLMYLNNIRPDIFFTVNSLNQFMVEPKRIHWAAARHILRYVCGTIEYGLKYTQRDDVRLCGFTDADWASSLVERKSTSR
eukprot:PITA_06542